MSNPIVWRRYISACKATGVDVDAGLSRFAARYRVATTLRGVSLEGMGEKSELGYLAALRCALAYSALETLDRALGSRGVRTPIAEEEALRAARSPQCAQLITLLTAELSDPKLVKSITSLVRSDRQQDVTPLVTGIRHVVFHGGFTAYGSGAAPSASVRRLLDLLTAATLKAADGRFESHLDEEALGPWSTRPSETCPSCRVRRGQLHSRTCDISRCARHGQQLIECDGGGKHKATHWRGVYPGTVEALKRGWIVRRSKGESPDLNRVISELTWDPAREMFVD